MWLHFFSCSSLTDRPDAPWPHHAAPEGVGHRNKAGEGHHQCRAHGAHPQWPGGLFLWLHCEVASVPHHKQVRSQPTEGKTGLYSHKRFSMQESNIPQTWRKHWYLWLQTQRIQAVKAILHLTELWGTKWYILLQEFASCFPGEALMWTTSQWDKQQWVSRVADFKLLNASN